MEYCIKVPGNSGCNVEIVTHRGKPAVRKFARTKDYVERLQNQREKQREFKSTINAIYIPKIIDYDDTSFTMEYLHMLDSIEFFETMHPKNIKNRLDVLFDLIKENFDTSETTPVKTNLFLDKLEAIEKAIPPKIWQKYYSFHTQTICQALPNHFIIPLGQCHGDLTFSNIMFSMEDVKVGLIDFLDSFLESPIIDIVKLRQDTKFNWTNFRYKMPHDTSKISIIMSWLDGFVESTFSEMINTDCFRILELMNYLRIAPYVKTIREHEYLYSILDILKIK